MIREIINFTNDLINDIPDILQWNNQPSRGLHIFIDLDEKGNWMNNNLVKGIDYDFFDGKNDGIPLWKDCIKYQEVSNYIEMNKVKSFDAKQKIHSCSPFSVAFNFNFNKIDKKALGIKTYGKGTKISNYEKDENSELIRTKRIEIVRSRLNDYLRCSSLMFFGKENPYSELINRFIELISTDIFYKLHDLEGYSLLTDKDYVRIYLRSFDFEKQKKYYQNYLQEEILNGDKISSEGQVLGSLGFMTTFTLNKIFLRHKTGMQINGVNSRFSKEEALILNDFKKLLERNVLPNPLPIVVDKGEINKYIVRLFNSESNSIGYRELVRKLFEQRHIKELPDYYLLFYSRTKNGIIFNDFDFVPSFRNDFDSTIYNYTELKDGKKKLLPERKIDNIFDLELEFNRLFLKYEKNTKKGVSFLINNYFGEKVESQKSFKQYFVTRQTLEMFYKYRKAIYDYVYKTKYQSITCDIFDEIVYSAIISDIHMDQITKGLVDSVNHSTCSDIQKGLLMREKHSKYYSLREKINLWFSLSNSFYNSNNKKIMASKVTDLMSKIRSVAKGEIDLETPEEFAFGAGQIVSYLIDKSVASNKTYAMLEPYLQKTKSNFLQDAIAQTIAIYKHDISVYKGKFEKLSAQVLTYGCNVEMKPLLKYFLAGCFCDCVIYESEKK